MKVLQIRGDRRGAFVWERMENAQSLGKISEYERDRGACLSAGVRGRKADGSVANREVVGGAVGQGE